MPRKTITFPDNLHKAILDLATTNDRSFSKQVVNMCKAEALRREVDKKRPIYVVNEPEKEKRNGE